MRERRGRHSVQPLGYVMFTKDIFRRAKVFVLEEVCLPRRPNAANPGLFTFCLFTKNPRGRQDLHADVS